MKNILAVFALLVCFGVLIHMSIKYPLESGFYLFTKEGRALHADEVADDVRIKGLAKETVHRRKGEKEYQQWKERVRKEEAFRKRYEQEM